MYYYIFWSYGRLKYFINWGIGSGLWKHGETICSVCCLAIGMLLVVRSGHEISVVVKVKLLGLRRERRICNASKMTFKFDFIVDLPLFGFKGCEQKFCWVQK